MLFHVRTSHRGVIPQHHTENVRNFRFHGEDHLPSEMPFPCSPAAPVALGALIEVRVSGCSACSFAHDDNTPDVTVAITCNKAKRAPV